MSAFEERLDALLGDGQDLSDIRVVVRRCWFFDFDGYPVRLWQGQGKLFTTDGNEWLGYITFDGQPIMTAPRIADGRDGTAPTYEFSLSLVDLPGMSAFEAYEALKADQGRVAGRMVTCSLALIEVGEGLRPQAPLEFFKDLTMQSTRFEERIEWDGTSMVKRYTATLIAKDGNVGRSSIPNGSYTSTVQRERARQLGVEGEDKGCDFVSGLADRTYVVP
jgi:hypothetical protein